MPMSMGGRLWCQEIFYGLNEGFNKILKLLHGRVAVCWKRWKRKAVESEVVRGRAPLNR